MSTSGAERSPATFLHLAPEIIDAIAEELRQWSKWDPQIMKDCSLVCKEFHSRFHPFIFRDIIIHELEAGVEKLQRLAALLSQNQHIREHVRSFKILLTETHLSEWGHGLSDISRQLPMLRDLHIGYYENWYSKLNDRTWISLPASYRIALANFLGSPSLVSLSITNNIIFDIPHRLLLSSPTLEKIRIYLSRDRYCKCDVGHWNKLDTNYLSQSDIASETKVSAITQQKLRSLLVRNGYTQSNWIGYIVKTQPTYLANLTHFAFDEIGKETLAQIQTVLNTAGVQLEDLDLAFHVRERPLSLPLDLSHCTGLRHISLRYGDGLPILTPVNGVPHDHLSFIITTISSLKAAFLHSVFLHFDWSCPGHTDVPQGSFPTESFLELDSCFSDLCQRHSRLVALNLSVLFMHSLGDKCEVWDELKNPPNTKDARDLNFPFLTGAGKPDGLKVTFKCDLSPLMRKY